jgi:hypothetical protein
LGVYSSNVTEKPSQVIVAESPHQKTEGNGTSEVAASISYRKTGIPKLYGVYQLLTLVRYNISYRHIKRVDLHRPIARPILIARTNGSGFLTALAATRPSNQSSISRQRVL